VYLVIITESIFSHDDRVTCSAEASLGVSSLFALKHVTRTFTEPEVKNKYAVIQNSSRLSIFVQMAYGRLR